MPAWDVRMLGGLRVSQSGGAPIHFRTRSAEVVFAYLALNLGRPIRRETLIEIAWPDVDESSGKQSLRTALSWLRKELGEECVESDRSVAAINSECFTIDAKTFRETRCPGDYTGRLLDGMEADWSTAQAQELEEIYFQAVLAQMDQIPRLEAIRLGSDALHHDPSRLDVRSKLRELGAHRQPGEVPLSTSSFVGRARELAEVDRLLADHRLVTLIGPGGCGKTRLAAEVWRRRAPNSWFVPLADLRQAQDVAEAMRQSLRIPTSPSRTPLEQVVSALSGEDGLLVIDNFEHLLPAVPDVLRLLTQCPSLRILVTSQIRLGLSQEIEYPVGPLSLQLSESTGLSDGVQLFMDRARAVRRSEELEASTFSIACLCERLDGYPLALEIAAAKTRVMSPAEMLSQLRDRFEFLTRQDAEQDRRQSLHAALDWSFDWLPSECQDLLADLSVFRGGFTLDSVAKICGIDNAAMAIETLVANAWVQQVSTTDGPYRFRLLESVREYAAEVLPPKRLRELMWRHADYFHQLAQDCMNAAFTPTEPRIHAQVDAEIHNLDAAWDWLIESNPNLALGIVCGLNWHSILKGHLQTAESRMAQALSKADLSPTRVIAHAYQCSGNFLLFQGKLKESIPWFEKAFDIATEVDWPLFQSMSLSQLAQISAEFGEYEKAYEIVERAISILPPDTDANWFGAGYVIACLAANRSGDTRRGIEMGRTALNFCRKGGYPWGIASALNELAMALHLDSQYQESLQLQNESIEIKRLSKTPKSLALSLVDAAATHLALGSVEAAQKCLAEAAEILIAQQSYSALPRLFLIGAELYLKLDQEIESQRCLTAFHSLINEANQHHAHLFLRDPKLRQFDCARRRLTEEDLERVLQLVVRL